MLPSPVPWADLVEEPLGLDRVGSVLTTELGRPRASVRPTFI